MPVRGTSARGGLFDAKPLGHGGSQQQARVELAAVALAREIRKPRVEADARNALGSVELCLGHAQQAAGHHRHALRLGRQISAVYPQPEALLGLVDTRLRLRLPGEVSRYGEQALALAR